MGNEDRKYSRLWDRVKRQGPQEDLTSHEFLQLDQYAARIDKVLGLIEDAILETDAAETELIRSVPKPSLLVSISLKQARQIRNDLNRIRVGLTTLRVPDE